ncbi:MAG: spore coat protein [Spirochaetales bacterium]|nr:spore coat protein [Spirochaetales bacterium]
MRTVPRRTHNLPGRFGIGLQARLNSTRLPRKALLPLAGEPSLIYALRRLARIPADIYGLLTDGESFEELYALGNNEGFIVCKGSTNDVLSRYASFVEEFRLDFVIRATGDNPLVFIDHLPRLIDAFVNHKADYGVTTFLPYGAGIELIRGSALTRAHQEASSSYDREHVCPYIYSEDRGFRIIEVTADTVYQGPHLRITLDSPEDYVYLQKLFRVPKIARSTSDRELITQILGVS